MSESQPAMEHVSRDFSQNLLDISHFNVKVHTHHERDLTEDIMKNFIDSVSMAPRAIGLGWAYTATGTLTLLAIASIETVLFVQFTKKTTSSDKHILAARRLLQEQLLCNPEVTLYAFDMGRIALSLYLDRDLCIRNAVNIQSACTCRDAYKVINAVKFAVSGTGIKANHKNIVATFHDFIWDASKRSCAQQLAFRAWLAAYMPSIGDMEERFRDVPRVDTKTIPEVQLRILAQLDRGDQRLDSQRASSVSNDFTFIQHNRISNRARVRSERFQNRLRSRTDIQVLVRDQHEHEYVIHGRTGDVSGQHADIIIPPPFTFQGKTIIDITTVSHEEPTQAEVKRDEKILRVLQHLNTLYDNSFLNLIWPGDSPVEWPTNFLSTEHVPCLLIDPTCPMNNSQQIAVLHMLKLDNEHRITLVQGPPGTGKTTVIATFVQTSIAAGYTGIWLVAQSNVAVKNIAEKLDSSGFADYKLLVSKDFHFDWHEHIYSRISSKIIHSDEFRPDQHDLSSTKVILCTLSMLSHFKILNFTSKVPMNFLIIDEASQIKVSDYIFPITANPTLRKICFIGDDKQLPPFGQEDIEDLQSIFERPHLRSSAIFLDIQYRMPPQIGDFISDAVYDGQLCSNPKHPQANAVGTCFFVDVKAGQEKSNETSYENLQEAEAVVKMAAVLQLRNKSYHIITPYDAQRTLIESMLKVSNLQWQNKCFNVDSFQGNEDNIIILSLVRSHGLGFLQDLRRTNVMLTRCKQILFICSSRAFLIIGAGAKSLVGRMAANFGEDAWLEMEDIDKGNF